jgi:hypothetical protein
MGVQNIHYYIHHNDLNELLKAGKRSVIVCEPHKKSLETQ